MPKLIFGCGYLGYRAAQRWRDVREQVYVVTRRAARATQLADEGFLPIVADVLRPESLVGLPNVDTVLYAVGYDRAAGASLTEVYVEGLRHVLATLAGGIERFIYISSTGVYGQSQGQWVDEDSPCTPEREGGRACLAAEHLLAAHALGERAIILRMGGIYGPGRIPQVDLIRRGEPIASPAGGYLNLIHVDDAARVVLRASQPATPPRTYNVTDGQPVQRSEYYAELARLVDASAPEFAAPPADSARAARAATDKRVKNDRMLTDLGITLDYPSYREGLAAILRDS